MEGFDVHLDEKSVRQEDGGVWSARVIVCRDANCTPVRVEGGSKASLAAHSEEAVRRALKDRQPENLAVVSVGADEARPSTATGQVIHVTSVAQYDDIVKKPQLIVIDFTASWCGPCQMVAPMYTALAAEHPGVVFLKVDVDELPVVAQRMKVRAMPTFEITWGPQSITRLVGARIKSVEHFVVQLGSLPEMPSKAKIEEVEKSCPDDSLPIGAILKFLAMTPIRIALDFLAYIHFVLLIWFIYPFTGLPNSLWIFVLFLGVQLIQKSPLRSFKLPLHLVGIK
jgi:thioredoxin 1